ncbi:hypothetical protein [Oceaniradius stylonematis]|jgi:hypothetical protein|nr:hypothetical protein [Oceaniradius stylonematis]
MTHTDPFDRDIDYDRARRFAALERRMAIDALVRRVFRLGRRQAQQR